MNRFLKLVELRKSSPGLSTMQVLKTAAFSAHTHGLECPPKLLLGNAGAGPVEVSLKELNRIL